MAQRITRLAIGCLAGIAFTSTLSAADDTTGATASDTAAQTAQVNLQQLQANLETTQIANDTSKQALRLAKVKDVIDTIPASNTSGAAATSGDNVGQLEATILSAQALHVVGAAIARKVRSYDNTKSSVVAAEATCKFMPMFDPPAPADNSNTGDVAGQPASPDAPHATKPPPPPAISGPLAIYTGTNGVSFTQYVTFRYKVCALANEYSEADKAQKKLFGEIEPQKDNGERVLPLMAAVAVVSKLVQLATPDWNLSNVSVTIDDRALASAVAQAYLDPPGRSVIWPQRAGSAAGAETVFAALDKLDEFDRQNQSDVADVKVALANTATKIAAAKKAKRDATGLQKTSDELTALSTRLTDDSAAYASLLASLDTTSGKATLPIGDVVEQAGLQKLLGRDGVVLLLSIDKVGGGLATRKAFWNIFGGMPYFVSGGAVVDFQLIRPFDQSVLAAGLMQCDAGFFSIDGVQNINSIHRAESACENRKDSDHHK